MSLSIKDLEARKRELEQEIQRYSTQHEYHTAESAKYERELIGAQARFDENVRYLRQAMAKHQEEKTEKRSTGAKAPHASAYQRFRSEGPTAVVVRLLYENRAGMTIFEMQGRNGIAIRARMIRKIVVRLMQAGCAVQQGDKKVKLTELGISLWEASPLFLRSRRDGNSRASQQ